MIEERASVVAVEDGIAEVATLQRSACGSCNAKAGCGTSILAAWFPQRKLTFRLPNTVSARAGDTVVVGLDEASLQRASAMLYGLPLLGLLAGAMLGEAAVGHFLASPMVGHEPGSELGAVSGGLLGLTAALKFVRRYSTANLRRRGKGVQLLRVVEHSRVIAPGTLAGVSVVNQTESIRKVE